MYNTSNTYKNDIVNGVLQENYITGNLILNNGRNIVVDNKIIIPESLVIDKRATDGAFNVGSVYISSLKISLILDNTKPADVYSGKITLNYNYKLSNGNIEVIPLGSYYVRNVSCTKKLFTLTCYDALYLFDEPIDEVMEGTPYQVITYFCNKYIGIELGMGAGDFNNFPNGSANIIVDPEYIETYRDALSNIASMMGGFVCIGRDNRLYIKEFSNASPFSLLETVRIKTTVNEDKTFIGKVIASFLQEENFVEYKATARSVGATIDLGEISLYKGVSSDSKHNILNNLANYLGNRIYYTPSNLDIISDPSWDAGDAFNFQYDGDTYVSLLTHLVWKYHKQQEMTSEGLDMKASNVRSSVNKTIKNISGGSGAGGEQWSDIVMSSTIYDDIVLDGERELLFLYIKIKRETELFLNASITIKADEDCDLECIYTINNNKLIDNNKIKIFSGEYKYNIAGISQLAFLPEWDNETAHISLAFKPSKPLTIKAYSNLTAIAADITRDGFVPSKAEDFDFNINWLNLNPGLYDEVGNLICSIGQLQTEGMSFTENATSSTAGSKADNYLNHYNKGSVLVIDNTVTATLPNYWIKDTYYLRTLIIKGSVSCGNNTLYQNVSIDKIYITKDFKMSNSSNYAVNSGKFFGATIYTDLKYGDTTLFNKNNNWLIVPETSGGSTSDNIQWALSTRGPIIWGIDSNSDLSYSVGEGQEGAGARFNATDLELPPGLYDSANRLMIPWDKLKELGIMADTIGNYYWSRFPHHRLDELAREKSSGLGTIQAIFKLFNQATKIILPNDGSVTRLNDRVLQGIGWNMRVLVAPYPLILGTYMFNQNNGITDIYLDKNSRARVTTSGHLFAGVRDDLKIFTNASDDANHTFFKAIATTGSDIVITNANITYDVSP